MTYHSKGIVGALIYIPRSEITMGLSGLRKKLTAVPRYKNLSPIPMFNEERDGYVGIPRYYLHQAFSHPEKIFEDWQDEVTNGKKIELVFKSDLYENQIPLYEEFERKLSRGKTGFILKARTGFGKTPLMLRFLSRIGRNALIIVPKTDLMEQWKKMILEHTNLSESQIGHVQAERAEYRNKAITLGMIHSVCRDKYGAAFQKCFGAVVWDECHKTGAFEFSKTVSMFPARYRLGCSATLERPDGMDIVFRHHLGETMISLATEREEEVRPQILVLQYRWKGPAIPQWARGLDTIRRRGVTISALADNKARSDFLLPRIASIALSGRRVLVLSERISQLKYFLDRTDKRHCPGLYINKTSDTQKDWILHNAGIIYATYGMFALGNDVPDLAALVFATPQAHILQPVGRISRLYQGKKRPVVLDLVDIGISECQGWYRKRLREYNHPDVCGTVTIVE